MFDLTYSASLITKQVSFAVTLPEISVNASGTVSIKEDAKFDDRLLKEEASSTIIDPREVSVFSHKNLEQTNSALPKNAALEDFHCVKFQINNKKGIGIQFRAFGVKH